MNEVICIGVRTPAEAAECLANRLAAQLTSGKTVLWLLSGGSSLSIACAAAGALADKDCRQLRIGLVDDFQDVNGSKATNYDQLMKLGFDVPGSQVFELVQDGKTPQECAAAYDSQLAAWLDDADYAIGQFGIGEGYHTGGIQPGSPAATELSFLAVCYEDGPTSRITVTPGLIKRLDVAFINSFGDTKRPMVMHFIESGADITAEPTQALKTAAETVIYSDA